LTTVHSYNKILPLKSINGQNFFFGVSAAGHFSRKFLPYVSLSGHTGSNGTGLMFVSYPGTESIAVHTDRIRIL
jgi:hypothetical protein